MNQGAIPGLLYVHGGILKTKELIRRLQEADPSGEEEVCVGNVDIFTVENLPGYYDGCQQVLIRNWDSPYYNVTGGRYNASGRKVKIHTLPFSDVLWENTDIPIDYSDLNDIKAASYKESDDKTRKASIEFADKIELEYFIKHCSQRAFEINPELCDLEEVCKKFYTMCLSPNDPMPVDLPVCGYSYVDRRNIQWGRMVDILFENDTWILRLK